MRGLVLRQLFSVWWSFINSRGPFEKRQRQSKNKNEPGNSRLQSRRYCRFSIFQDSGGRHLGFWKIQIFNGSDAQQVRTASTCQFLSKSLKMRLRYGDFPIFQDGGPPPSWIFKSWKFQLSYRSSVGQGKFYSVVIQNFRMPYSDIHLCLRLTVVHVRRCLCDFIQMYAIVQEHYRYDLEHNTNAFVSTIVTVCGLPNWRQSIVLSPEIFWNHTATKFA